jgi:AraC family transcriptional regulator, regulatory protein of adaptative response / methylated-DNA-[protein]-cysteine methyltransferase
MNTTTFASPSEAAAATRSPALLAASGPVVGVRTTRIYCRPHCRPGRAPRPENCLAFLNAEVAQEAGYRPCKQCRPDRTDDRSRVPELIRYSLGLTPVGYAFVALTERGIAALYLLDEDHPSRGLARLQAERARAVVVEDRAAVQAILDRLCAMLDGDLDEGEWPLDVRGTPFQQRVWDALRAIPRGETRTYGALASELGVPGAARAVGTACGANPVALLIPCHRVVGAGGSLGGYEWGLEKKRILLDIERSAIRRTPSRSAMVV